MSSNDPQRGMRMNVTPPSGPFVLDIRDPGRRIGHSKSFDLDVITADEMGTAVIGVLSGSTVHLDVLAQAVGEGILVTGIAVAPVVGECSRCLTELRYDETVDLAELFCYPPTDARGRLIEPDEDAESDTLWVVDDHVDLGGPITDALVLDLPLAPLCRPDCPGLCPQCGVALAEDPGHSHPDYDPRWSGLATLLRPEGEQPEGGSDSDADPAR